MVDLQRLKELLEWDIGGLKVLQSRISPENQEVEPGGHSYLDMTLRYRSEQLDMVKHLINGGTVNYWSRR